MKKNPRQAFFFFLHKETSLPLGDYTSSGEKVMAPQTYVGTGGRGEISGAQDEHSDKGKYRRGDLTVY